MLRLSFLLAALVALAACDSTVDPPGPDVREDAAVAPLRAYETAAFGRYGDAAVEDPFGIVLSPVSGVSSSGEEGALFGAFLSGLWLGGDQDGAARANVVWYGRSGSNPPLGNFTTACGQDAAGLFALSSDTTYTETGAWPRMLGAPVNTDGSPRVYGDRMLWGSFCPASVAEPEPFASPFEGVRVNVAVYGFDRADLRGVRFVRYEVTSTRPISDLRVGYFSDTDSPRPGADAVGFDAGSGLSYVYNLGKGEAGQYLTPWVSGFAFLDTPKDAPLLAHRIMRKNDYYNPEFGEYGVSTPAQLIYALSGLSNDGAPMTDPATEAASRFAFTGDPFAGTGWRDGLFAEDGSYTGVDVRHLTSVGPVGLAPGETVAFTVAWVTAVEGTPSASQSRVAQTLAAVRAERALWQF